MSYVSKIGRVATSLTVAVSLVAPATVARAETTGTPTSPTPLVLSSPDTGCLSVAPLFGSGESGTGGGSTGGGGTTTPGTGGGTMPTATSGTTMPTAFVNGRVTNALGNGIANAMVFAIDQASGKPLGCKDTDSLGNYTNLPAGGVTRIIATGPKGSSFANLASKNEVFTPESGQTYTKNLQLSNADVAIAFVYSYVDSVTGENVAPEVDTHLVLACLQNIATQDFISCGLSRDRSSTLTPMYDVRLDTTGISAEDSDNVGIYAFGAISTPDGVKNLEGNNTFPKRPAGTTRLDALRSTYDPALINTQNQAVLPLYDPSSGGGGSSGDLVLDNPDEGCASVLALFGGGGTGGGGTAPASTTQPIGGSASSGRVTDASGNGVAGAMVFAIDQSSGSPLGCQDTNADGYYSNLPASGTTRIIASGPSGASSAALASATTAFAVETGVNYTKNFTLSPADIAVGFVFENVDGSGNKTYPVVNTHLVLACLQQISTQEFLACGLSRDHSGDASPKYDVRLDTTSIPSDLANDIGVYAFGGIATPSGTRNVERKATFDTLPDGTSRLDFIREIFNVAAVGTDQIAQLTLFESNNGGGGDNGGGGMPSTNCAADQTPFINGSLKSPNNDPGINYYVELGAFWSLPGATGQSMGWLDGWNLNYGSGYQVGGDQNGAFTLCRNSSYAPYVPEGATVSFFAKIFPALAPGDHSAATTVLVVGDSEGSTTYTDCLLNMQSTCSLNLQAMAPQVDGYVKSPSNEVIPGTYIQVVRNSGTNEEPMFSDYEALFTAGVDGDGWFGLAMNFGSGELFKVVANPPYCDPYSGGGSGGGNNGGSLPSTYQTGMEGPTGGGSTGGGSTGGGTSCPYADLIPAVGYFVGGPGTTWAGSSSSTKNFTFQTANFAGTLTDWTGKAFNYKNLYFTCATSDPCTTPSNVYTDMDGAFSAFLNDGSYSIRVYGDYDQSSGGMSETYFSVDVAGGSVTKVSRTAPGAAVDLCGGTATACTSNISLRTAAPNFRFIVRTDEGTTVEGAGVQLNSFTEENAQYGGTWYTRTETGDDNPRWGSPGVPGVGGVGLVPGTVYRITLSPPFYGESEASTTELYIKTESAPDGSLLVYRCAKWNFNPQELMPCGTGYNGEGAPGEDDLISTESDGNGGSLFLLTMQTSNFKGTLCRPGVGDCTPVSNTWIEVQQMREETYTDYQGTPFTNRYWTWFGGAQVSQNGNFSLAFTTTGAYKLSLNQPWNQETGTQDSDLARTEVRVWVDVDGNGAATVSLATADGHKIEGTSLEVINGRFIVRYATPNVLGLLVDPDGGNGARNTWIEVLTESASGNCTGCTRRDRYTVTPTDAQGRFAVNLPDGAYIIRANPAWGTEGLTVVEYSIRVQDCNADGTSEVYSGSAGDCTTSPTPIELEEGRIVIRFATSNFVGTLRNPLTGEEVRWSGFNYEKWNGTSWQWQSNSWSNTNQVGRFNINFTEPGRYRVNFNVPWNLKSQLADARVIVEVEEEGGLMVATPDVAASGGSSVIAPGAQEGSWEVAFALPNASGYIKSPDGTQIVARAWINVQKWYEPGSYMCWNGGCWNWTGEVGGTSSDNVTGAFSMNLPQGHWRLQVNPPYDQLSYTMAQVDVLVDANGNFCLADVATSVCEDEDRILPGQFDIRLGAPNMTGYVVTKEFTPNESDGGPGDGWDGERSRWSQVRFEKWNADYQYWQWANVWAQTNYNGYFSQNITEDGVYRVNFDPSWQLNDYSYVTRYLAVCSGGTQVAYIPEGQVSSWNCATPATPLSSAVTNQVVLRGANVKGLVTKSGTPLGDAWISVSSCQANPWGGEWCYWVKGANTPRADWNPANAGKFNFRIDNDGPAPVKYRFEINPPWNDSSGLVRQQVDVYFYDFLPGVDGTEYCIGSLNASDGCDDPQTDADTWNIALTSGNLAGKVISPNADCGTSSDPALCTGMAGAWISVEKWQTMPWNPGMYGWMWQPLWANTTGNWGSEDAASGNFGLNITESGVYRITVNPSWNNPNSYSRTTYVVNVASNGNWCVNEGVASNSFNSMQPTPTQASCTPSSTDNADDSVTGFTARLAGSNLAGVLYDSTASLPADKDVTSKKVKDTWMSLQKEIQSTWCWGASPDQCYTWTYWQWTSGASASGAYGSEGKFGFTITEPGNYRLEVYPAWNNSAANAQFRLDFTVDESGGCVAGNSDPTNCVIPSSIGSASKDIATGAYLVKYPAPNFTGTLYDKNGSAGGVKVGGAWMSVMNMNTFAWVGGTSTTWNGPTKGSFAMLLDTDGQYRVEIYPPWDQPDVGMRRVLRVTVSGGLVTRVLLGESGDNALCGDLGGETPCGATLNLALLGANVSGHVYYPGDADTADDAYAASVITGTQTVMPWAGVQVFKCDGDWNAVSSNTANCYQWVTWSNTDHTGTLRLSLETDGVYRVQVWPNYGYFQSGMLEADIEITGGVMSKWRYKGSVDDEPTANGFTPDFGRRKPNVSISVAGITSARYVQISACAAGSVADSGTPGTCDSPTVLSRIETTYNSSTSSWKVSLNLEPGIYKIGVIRKSTDAADPTNVADIVEVAADTTDTNVLSVNLDLTSSGGGG